MEADFPDEGLREGAGAGRCPDKDGRADRAGDGDRVRQVGRPEPGLQQASGIDRERPLIVRQPRPAEVDEAPAVEHDDGRGGRPRIHPLRDQLTVEEGRDPDRRCAGAHEHEPVGGQAAPSPSCREQAGQDDRRGALHVIVEARQPVSIPFQDPNGIVLLEVLPLDDGGREDPDHGFHECLHDRVVRRAAQPWRPMTQVERIVEEGVVVGADIERDGQRPGRIDARRRGVEGKLSDRDRHPTSPLVAETEDALVVGHDDQADVVAGRAKDVVDPADIVGGDPDAAWTPEDVAELLAREADRRGVDDREELFEVFDEQPVEQGLVAVLESRQSDVAFQVVVLAADVLQLERELLIDRRHTRRDQAVQAMAVSLPCRERRALVEQWLCDQVAPAPCREVTGRSDADRSKRCVRGHVGGPPASSLGSDPGRSVAAPRWANRYAARWA